jgi:hypothetical protein
MLALPRPYPDELLGSALLRACRATGLAPVRLLKALGAASARTGSPLLPSALPSLAGATALPAKRLLHEHTMFPYLVARLPPPDAERIETIILAGEPPPGALVGHLLRAVPRRRFCPACVAEDLRVTGEAYWRRSHHLPAVRICPAHGDLLCETDISLRGALRGTSLELPHETPIRGVADRPALADAAIAHLSTQLLAGRPADAPDISTLRQRAHALGYIRADGHIASVPLVRDLLGFFGQAMLDQTGCRITRNESNAWPALMLRQCHSTPFSTVKHVLLEVFLRYGTADRAHWDYRPPGPRTRDRTDEDRQCARRLEQLLRHAAKTRKFLTVRELLTLAGCWHAFRHRRAAFRETDTLVQKLARRLKVGCR